MTTFIFGCGFTGQAIAHAMPGEVVGTTRSSAKFEAIAQTGATPLVFDGTLTEPIRAALADTRILVQSIAPARASDGHPITDPVLRAFGIETLRTLAPNLEWIAYLSTVGVYGDHDGAWVDETSELRPVSDRSLQRVAAEQEWFAQDVPTAVLRLSGIYGPGRNGVEKALADDTRRLVKPGQVFNRIHVADIAGAVAHLATTRPTGPINITDDEPAPPQDVVLYAHTITGTPPPPENDFATADLSPMARSFYGENKRVSNALSKGLGVIYAYPNYRVAFDAIWETLR